VARANHDQRQAHIVARLCNEGTGRGLVHREEAGGSDGMNDHNNTRRFLTSDEAADYLGGLNSRTVTRWAREGYLPAIPVGEGKRRLWRFLESDLELWMVSRRTGHGTLFSAADASSKGSLL
jgi:excisionase family DNA binding protein